MASCSRGVLHLLNVCLLSTSGIWSSGFLCDSLFWVVHSPFSELLPLINQQKWCSVADSSGACFKAAHPHQEFFGREVHTTGRPSEIQGAAVQLGARCMALTDLIARGDAKLQTAPR